jgi:hypothetical protein
MAVTGCKRRCLAVTHYLVNQFYLDLLDFDESLPLLRQQMVKLLVQLPNLQLRLEIDLIIVHTA